MAIAMSPTTEAQYRHESAKPSTFYNHASRLCHGPCKKKHSIGQFKHSSEVCDQCFKRMPKTA